MTENQGNAGEAHGRENRPIVAQPIGRAVHQIWVQGDPIGEPLLLMEGARAMCARGGRPYYRWRESKEIDGRLVSFKDGCDYGILDSEFYAKHAGRCPNYSVRADLMRFIVLREFGGLYLDADTDMIDLPSPDLVGAWIMSMDAPPAVPRSVNCAVMAGPPAHPYFARLLARVEREPKVLEHPYAGMGMAIQELTGADVNLWPFDAWNDVRHRQWGVRPARYGTHLYRGLKWGSQRRIA